MTTESRHIHPALRIALEMGPLAVFFITYTRTDIFAATAVFVPLILVTLGISWRLTRKLPKMAAVTAVMVTVFGGLTLWLQDETFIKMKPTIVNLIFAGGLGWGLLRGRSYLRDLMGETVPMTEAGWRIFTARWALFFLVMAVINEVVWRTQSTDFWIGFKTFGSPIVTFTFVMTQFPLLKKHGNEGESES
ncbi:MAG: intracellular septation protein [Paracoccaceae bacterium]|jgi:intracellular septation protein